MTEEITTTKREPYSESALKHIEKLSGRERQLRIEVDRLRGENSDLQRELRGTTKERDELKIKADTSVAAKRVTELEGLLRERDTRAAFNRLALNKNANPKALDDLYILAKIPVKEQIDEAEIGVIIDEQAKSRSWGFTAAPDPNAPPAARPAPGSGQGGTTTGPSPYSMQDGDPRISDVRYQMANAGAIQAAAMERLTRGELRP